jgi:hypothetical protein
VAVAVETMLVVAVELVGIELLLDLLQNYP